jgi:5-methylthioadenosine/S-adenosylhomocysteine deaminase
MIKTLANCHALLGEDARQSDGPVDIIIDGKSIRDIRPSGRAAHEGEVLDLSGRLVAAGLINCHHHSSEGYYKGRKDNLPLELWFNYVRPLKAIEFTPREIYLRTMIGAIEAVHSGTTTISDDVNVSPRLRPDHVDAVFQAYEDIGIRAMVAPTLFDRPFFRAVPFVDEEFPKDLLQELDTTPMYTPAELLEFARGLAKTRHPKEHRVGYMAAPSAPQRCTKEFLLDVRRMADDFDLPIMMHVQETRLQVVTGQLWYGCTPLEYLHRIGFMKPTLQLIHGIWLKQSEIDILAETGVSVQHNPGSNLKVGSGLAPVRALLDAGVNVSMGTDGCGSIEGTDMQNVLYLAGLVHKLRGDHTTWVGAAESLRAATVGGARALGRGSDLGAIAPGRTADLTAYNLDTIPFTPLNNAVNQLVFAASRREVDLVMVDGEVIKRDGRLTRVDEHKLLREIQDAHARLAPLLSGSEKDVERMLAPYERIYRRCQHIDISPETYPARFSR